MPKNTPKKAELVSAADDVNNEVGLLPSIGFTGDKDTLARLQQDLQASQQKGSKTDFDYKSVLEHTDPNALTVKQLCDALVRESKVLEADDMLTPATVATLTKLGIEVPKVPAKKKVVKKEAAKKKVVKKEAAKKKSAPKKKQPRAAGYTRDHAHAEALRSGAKTFETLIKKADEIFVAHGGVSNLIVSKNVLRRSLHFAHALGVIDFDPKTGRIEYRMEIPEASPLRPSTSSAYKWYAQKHGQKRDD